MPHSDIHGSKPARGSPWLFAACHVLHRLLVPRHPPNALLSLKTLVPEHAVRRPTMHRNHPQLQSSVFSRQSSETTAGQIPAPATKNDPVLDHLAQNHRVPPPIEARDNGLPMACTTHASEHICHGRGRTHPPRGILARHRPHPVRLATAARPETHQNLIYSNKDHTPGLVPVGHAPGLTRGQPIKGRASDIAAVRRTTCHNNSNCRNNLPRNNPGNTEPLASP